MEYTLEISIDKDRNGAIKLTRDGSYRFSLLFKTGEEPPAIVRGFRIDRHFARVIPPAIIYGKQPYLITIIPPPLEARMISTVKSLVQPETTELPS